MIDYMPSYLSHLLGRRVLLAFRVESPLRLIWLIVFDYSFFEKSLYAGWSWVYCPAWVCSIWSCQPFQLFRYWWGWEWQDTYCSFLCFPDIEMKVFTLTALGEVCNSIVIVQSWMVISEKRKNGRVFWGIWWWVGAAAVIGVQWVEKNTLSTQPCTQCCV